MINPRGIKYGALYSLGPRVIEPVPISERTSGRYLWRGAHVGKIALNFTMGMPRLNAGYEPLAHFTPSYRDAAAYALELANGERETQFDMTDSMMLGARSGSDWHSPLPAIVLGLDTTTLDDEHTLADATMGMGDGIEFQGELLLSHIDPYSRAFLEQELGINQDLAA